MKSLFHLKFEENIFWLKSPISCNHVN